MAGWKKVAIGASGGAAEPLDIADTFSTFVYDGSSSSQTITNGLDLSSEGGMVWIKSRFQGDVHYLFDTNRGTGKYLIPNDTGVSATNNQMLTAFNTDGFTVGTDYGVNQPNQNYVAWSFRQAKNFFKIVEYTGTGSAQTISHGLGSTPGCIIVKRIDGTSSNWFIYHKGLNGGSSPEGYVMYLNNTSSEASTSNWNNTAPTASVFSVAGNGNSSWNNSGSTYMAYVFADNDGTGTFGPDGDQDVIRCGRFTTPSSATDTFVDVGFEPDFLFVKMTGGGNGYLHDYIRSLSWGNTAQPTLYAEQAYYETQITSNDFFNPTAKGFYITSNAINQGIGTNQNVTYIAVRRGRLTPAENVAGTDFFYADGIDGSTALKPNTAPGWPVEFSITNSSSGSADKTTLVRPLRGYLRTNETIAEQIFSTSYSPFDHMDTFHGTGLIAAFSLVSWMWRKYPHLCDCFSYKGDSVDDRQLEHNLGVAPELTWIKKRTAADDWEMGSGFGSSSYQEHQLNSTNAANNKSYSISSLITAQPTSSYIQLGTNNNVNGSGQEYICFLFASMAGVAKVGTYTGNNSTNSIDCGFTSGARLIIIKGLSIGTGTYIFDSYRGNNSRLFLNSTAAPNTSSWLNNYSAGFELNGSPDSTINQNGSTYMFYAIA